MVLAKFRCNMIEDYGPNQDTVHFGAVSDDGIPEHQRFHEATPSGKLDLTITNKHLKGFFKPGEYYYLQILTVAEMQ